MLRRLLRAEAVACPDALDDARLRCQGRVDHPTTHHLLLALGFTIASFWWIQVRRGRLRAYTGYVFTAAIAKHKTVIYIPMVFHNPAPASQAVC